ncbi:hypothetical protein R6Q59_031204 [Mikania micrantha]
MGFNWSPLKAARFSGFEKGPRTAEMSGAAESSAAGAKRARRSSSSRRRAREIHYSSPEILPIEEDEPVPIDDRVLRDHTVLQFEQGTEEATRCERFVMMEHYHHRTFDRELLERLGRLEEMMLLLEMSGGLPSIVGGLSTWS